MPGTYNQNLTRKGFSDDIAERIIHSQRESTRNQYQNRWLGFVSWCRERGQNPPKASFPLIADFLTFLFVEKKRTPGTIKGYRTAIADALRFNSKVDVTNDVYLSKLLANFYKECPRKKEVCPRWNIALVLNALTQAPFEPMASADMKFVTWKTAFLILLASGSRASEVHALEFNSLKFQENYRYVLVEPVPEFKAKTANKDARSQRLEIIKIPALTPTLSPDMREDKSLCPVRAIKVYRARSEEFRKQNSSRRLFISFKKGFSGDIHRNTFVGWIKSLILFAHKNSTDSVIKLSQAKVHEVRAMSASIGWKANLSLADVLQAGTWKSHTTFTDFYLKDISLIQGDLHTLGPLAVAQQVVQVPTTH